MGQKACCLGDGQSIYRVSYAAIDPESSNRLCARYDANPPVGADTAEGYDKWHERMTLKAAMSAHFQQNYLPDAELIGGSAFLCDGAGLMTYTEWLGSEASASSRFWSAVADATQGGGDSTAPRHFFGSELFRKSFPPPVHSEARECVRITSFPKHPNYELADIVRMASTVLETAVYRDLSLVLLLKISAAKPGTCDTRGFKCSNEGVMLLSFGRCKPWYTLHLVCFAITCY